MLTAEGSAPAYQTHIPLNVFQRGSVAVLSALGAVSKCVTGHAVVPQHGRSCDLAHDNASSSDQGLRSVPVQRGQISSQLWARQQVSGLSRGCGPGCGRMSLGVESLQSGHMLQCELTACDCEDRACTILRLDGCQKCLGDLYGGNVRRMLRWNTHGHCHQEPSVGHMHVLWGTAIFRLMTGAQHTFSSLTDDSEQGFREDASAFLPRTHVPNRRPPVRFLDDEELAYVAQRSREIHDFWHVLFGCHTNVFGELTLKAVEFVQGRALFFSVP